MMSNISPAPIMKDYMQENPRTRSAMKQKLSFSGSAKKDVVMSNLGKDSLFGVSNNAFNKTFKNTTECDQSIEKTINFGDTPIKLLNFSDFNNNGKSTCNSCSSYKRTIPTITPSISSKKQGSSKDPYEFENIAAHQAQAERAGTLQNSDALPITDPYAL